MSDTDSDASRIVSLDQLRGYPSDELKASTVEPSRIISLDQFRGYTVLGMFFVNFVGSYLAVAAIFKHHHTYCSYADTIMPQFFLAVGFAYRMTLLKRLETVGPRRAYLRVVRRNLGLILLGVVVYGLDGTVRTWAELQALGVWGFVTTAFQRNVFQTLVHIGVTALWVLPVIAARPSVRVTFAVLSAALHVALSDAFYYDWVWRRPGIDGGPLGFLTWTVPMLAGSLAYDAVAAGGERRPIGKLLGWGVLLMLLGYALSCLNGVTGAGTSSAGLTAYLVEPPFVPPSQPVDLWTMSQRAGSVSYLTFGAGFSLALYALFVLACDVYHLRLRVLDTLGQNALAGYVIHMMVNRALKPYVPRDAPLWYVLAGFALSFAICYLFLRHLEKHRLYLRL